MSPRCVEIPAGSGWMGGGPDDKFANATELPRREVKIETPFRMSVNPVTVHEWQAWQPERFGGVDPELPATGVSWFEATEYCDWLGRQGEGDWRLPTEEEWEYGCRAGTETPFHTGTDIGPSEANFLYAEDGRRIGVGALLPVGSFESNPFGLHDMHGNVSEWTADPWRASLDRAAETDESRRTVRGGAWDYLPRLLRSSWRDALPPTTRRDNLGFRVVEASR